VSSVWSRRSVTRCPSGHLQKVVTALQAIDLVAAVTVLAEIGDLSLFQNPRELMGYLGLVPCRFRKVRFARSGDVARQESDTRQCFQLARLGVCRARPVAVQCEFVSRYNRHRTSQEFAEGALRRTRSNDQCTRALSTRSVVPNIHFARASGTRWAGLGYPWLAPEP
jgi:Transposase IS116/IS110/IS902 family